MHKSYNNDWIVLISNFKMDPSEENPTNFS